MLNEVQKVFADLTDAEVICAVNEMREDEPTGIIRTDGMVRTTCAKIASITGESPTTHLLMVQFGLLREAAHRFTPNLT